MENDKMAELTLDKKNNTVVIAIDPDSEFTIREVTRFTGLPKATLIRLDGKDGFPASSRDIFDRRVWRAVDLIEIRRVWERVRANMRKSRSPKKQPRRNNVETIC